MRLFSGLYARVMQWARHRYATWWLALVSFTESSCFLVPPDVMLAPMTLARPERAWFYATLTTVASVLGGMLGFAIGLFAFKMAEPTLVALGYMDAYQQASAWFDEWGVWAVFIAGFTPVPYKIFTIAAGAAAMAFWPFVLGSLVGRGLRFFLVAGLMRWGGAELEAGLHVWIDRIGWVTVLILVTGYLLLA